MQRLGSGTWISISCIVGPIMLHQSWLALSHVESDASRLGKVNKELMSTLVSDPVVISIAGTSLMQRRTRSWPSSPRRNAGWPRASSSPSRGLLS
jgi:hypothetical protein